MGAASSLHLGERYILGVAAENAVAKAIVDLAYSRAHCSRPWPVYERLALRWDFAPVKRLGLLINVRIFLGDNV